MVELNGHLMSYIQWQYKRSVSLWMFFIELCGGLFINLLFVLTSVFKTVVYLLLFFLTFWTRLNKSARP